MSFMLSACESLLSLRDFFFFCHFFCGEVLLTLDLQHAVVNNSSTDMPDLQR